MTQSQKDAFYDKLFAMIINELKEDEGFLKYVLNAVLYLHAQEELAAAQLRCRLFGV